MTSSLDLAVTQSILDALCPFCAIISADGAIVFAGKTLRKIVPLTGADRRFFDLFDVTSPLSLRDARGLERLVDHKILLQVPGGASRLDVTLRGHIVLIDAEQGLYLLNTALHSDILDVVEAFDLDETDFSFADGSIDMGHTLRTQQRILSRSFSLTQQLESARKTAEELALIDPLTGLNNRRALSAHLSDLSTTATGSGTRTGAVSFIHLDLDRFKHINETLGHGVGDKVLIHVARLLGQCLGDTHFIARTSGDEFVLVRHGSEDIAGDMAQCEHLLQQMAFPIDLDGNLVRLSASIGFAVGTPLDNTFEHLAQQADLALYETKTKGPGRVRFFDTALAERYADVNEIAREIAPALENGEFVPFFQPQFDLVAGRLRGMEVLMRWDHPTRGILTPARFLYAADLAKLLTSIDRQVRERALSIFAGWKHEGLDVGCLSFNLTAETLTDTAFRKTFRAQIDAVGLTPQDVSFELLESILIDDHSEHLVEGARELEQDGFKLSLDDFGTGRASISSLLALPISTVKIDRSFVNGLHSNETLQTLTSMIVDLARRLDLGIVAEGVETQQDLAHLMSIGCTTVQGYLISKPLCAADLAERLRHPWPAMEDLARSCFEQMDADANRQVLPLLRRG